MFGIGIFELVIVAVFALLFIGPQDLPVFFSKITQQLVRFKRLSQEVKYSLEDMLKEPTKPETQETSLKMTPVSPTKTSKSHEDT